MVGSDARVLETVRAALANAQQQQQQQQQQPHAVEVVRAGPDMLRVARLTVNVMGMSASVGEREVVARWSTPGMPVVRRIQGVGPEHSAWLAEFALRIASDPVTVGSWAGEHAETSVKKLLDVPTLARAARFLVLAVEQQKKSLRAAGELYAGWGWSS